MGLWSGPPRAPPRTASRRSAGTPDIEITSGPEAGLRSHVLHHSHTGLAATTTLRFCARLAVEEVHIAGGTIRPASQGTCPLSWRPATATRVKLLGGTKGRTGGTTLANELGTQHGSDSVFGDPREVWAGGRVHLLEVCERCREWKLLTKEERAIFKGLIVGNGS